MVDFNNETTITTNPKDVYNILLIQHNEYVLDSLEAYEKHKYQGITVSSHVIRARIKNLYRHIRQDYKRNVDAELYHKAQELYNSDKLEDLFLLYEEYVSDYLAKIGLTSKTIKKDYDSLNATEEDDAKGL